MANRRKRILFTCQPFGAHLYPHAPVIKRFEAQGHEVRLATPDKLAQTARHYGIQHIPAGQDWTADPAIRAGVARLLLEEGNDAFCEASFAHLARAARSMAPDLLSIAKDWRPDVIVTDPAEFGGYLAGERLGIPVISSDNGLARLIHDLWDPTIRPILSEIREDLGMAPEPEGIPGSFKTLLTPAPKELLLPDLELPGLVSFRHENPRRIGERLPDGVFETDDQTKVYAMFGSTGSSVPEWGPIFEGSNRLAIEALGNEEYDVLLSVGRGNVGKYADFEGSEEELRGRAVPARGAPNVKVVAHTAQPLALERADVALLHAGFGGLREALVGGTPALYMPNQTDQPSNARLLGANGLGLTLDPRTATAGDVAARVQELVARNAEFSANFAQFQERMQQLPSLAELTEAIDRSLEVGDLEFRGLKEPPADPGADGRALGGPRPDGPITIVGPAGAGADPRDAGDADSSRGGTGADIAKPEDPEDPEDPATVGPEIGPPELGVLGLLDLHGHELPSEHDGSKVAQGGPARGEPEDWNPSQFGVPGVLKQDGYERALELNGHKRLPEANTTEGPAGDTRPGEGPDGDDSGPATPASGPNPSPRPLSTGPGGGAAPAPERSEPVTGDGHAGPSNDTGQAGVDNLGGPTDSDPGDEVSSEQLTGEPGRIDIPSLGTAPERISHVPGPRDGLETLASVEDRLLVTADNADPGTGFLDDLLDGDTLSRGRLRTMPEPSELDREAEAAGTPRLDGPEPPRPAEPAHRDGFADLP